MAYGAWFIKRRREGEKVSMARQDEGSGRAMRARCIVAKVINTRRRWHKEGVRETLLYNASKRGVCESSNGSGEEGTGAKESHAQAAGPTTADRGVERAGPEQRKAEAAG